MAPYIIEKADIFVYHLPALRHCSATLAGKFITSSADHVINLKLRSYIAKPIDNWKRKPPIKLSVRKCATCCFWPFWKVLR